MTELVDDRVAQKIRVQNSQAEATKAYEQYEIQVIQNESDIASAEMKVTFAAIDKEKYEEGEWPQEFKESEEKILIKKEELIQAEDKLEWTVQLAEKGFVQRTELERDQLAVQRSQIELEQATRQKALLTEYENPRRVVELNADIEEMGRDLRRVEKQSSARLADYEAARETTKAKLELETQKLAKIEDQISKARIIAPEMGIVVYGRSKSGRHMSGGEPVSEGGDVSERQDIATLPREGGMIVAASLHETVLKRVAVGQPCTIQVDAMPGMSFAGRVEFVAVLPDANSWYANPNQRVYRSEISITDGTPEMRPGMSCSVEILSETIENTLYVPVQTVFVDAGKPICFVKTGREIKMRKVTIGSDNSKWVAIESGLEEGELVLLSPPVSFTPSGTPESERIGAGQSDGAPQGLPDGASADGRGMPSQAMREAMRGKRGGMPGGGARGGRPGGERGSERGGRGRSTGGGEGQARAERESDAPGTGARQSEDSE